MRRSLTLPAMLLLSLTPLACGSSGVTRSTSASPTASTSAHSGAPSAGGYSKDDGDNDFDDAPHYHGSPPNDDQALLATYGPKASPAVTRAVTSLVKRYYTVSAAGNGAAACSLLTASLAEELVAGHGQPGAPTCAAGMSKLLSQQHAHLLGENVPTMEVTTVHTNGTLGLAVLRFKASPESEIVLEREGHTWKINALFGNSMT